MRDGSLSAEQVASIARLAKKKLSPREIANLLGLSANLVRVRLCRMRKAKVFELPLAMRTTALTDEEVKEFWNKHKGKTIAQVHRETGHARTHITKLLARWIILT